MSEASWQGSPKVFPRRNILPEQLTKFSVSDASNFKLCPRSFLYRKVEGYEPFTTANHLTLGIQYDKLLETYDIRGFDAAFFEISYIFPDPHEAAEAEIILKAYHAYVKDDPLPPIADRGNQHGFGVDTDGVRITGYLDKLSVKTISGMEQYVVTERKTTSESIEENSVYWNRLDLDPQIRSYVWYLRSRGLQAGWVCYEVIRKLSSSYTPKLGKKKDIPIDQYRSLLAALNYNKTLVARKWVYVDVEATKEFEQEHKTVFSQFKTLHEATAAAKQAAYKLEDYATLWPKHEQSCDAYGGCPYGPICKKQTTFDNAQFLKKEGRFAC